MAHRNILNFLLVLQLLLNALWFVLAYMTKSAGIAYTSVLLLWMSVIAILLFANLSKGIVLLLVPYILWIYGISYSTYFSWQGNQALAAEPVACTMEAKLCPDGSYVGRTGPSCEFAACPGGK